VSALRLQGGERIPCDAVVDAAGPEADVIAAMLGRKLPLKPRGGLLVGGLLVNLAVEDAPVGRLLHSPCVNLRLDGPPGRVLVHHGSVDAKLESDGDTRGSLSRELLERARRVVPALEGAKVERVPVGVRLMPVDGLPCVVAVAEFPGYYEAITHSGVTLGPLLGRLLAKEILTGEADALVAPFRPDRFTSAR